MEYKTELKNMPRFCTNCGTQNEDTAQICQSCRAPVIAAGPGGYQPNYQANYYGGPPQHAWKVAGAEKKLPAGICGILIGALGIHKFILGYNTEGLIMLLVTLLTCGIGGMVTGVIGLVEGIIYLTKSDDEFVRTYIQNKKGWF
jgi:TM2 domain-containing membrane protein YozV